MLNRNSFNTSGFSRRCTEMDLGSSATCNCSAIKEIPAPMLFETVVLCILDGGEEIHSHEHRTFISF